MRSLVSTTSLARASARHPWRTIAAWLVVLTTAIALMVTLLNDALTTEVTTLTNNPESAQAEALIRERLGETTSGEFVIVQSATGATIDSPEFQTKVEQLQADLIALGPEFVTSVSSYYQTGDESLVSPDRMTTLLPVVIPDVEGYDVLPIHELVKASAESPEFQVLATGQATLDAEIQEVAERDLAKGESIGLPLALFILAVVFGALVAAFLPILLAIIAVLLALGGVAVLGQFMELPFVVMNVMIMLGLAVGIDYSLFVVSRYREERARGVDKVEAIARTGGSAGRTVVVSGLTVAIAMAGMLIMPDSSNKAVGAGAVLVVAAAVLTSMTLLPALLSLFGDKVNSPRIPFLNRATRPVTESTGGFWTWTTILVMRRPVVSLLLAAGLLLAAAWSVLDMRQGEIGIAGMPESTMSREAYGILERDFGFGQDLPALVVINGQTDSPAIETSLAALESTLTADPAFATMERETHPESDLTILHVWLTGDALSPNAMAAVRQLRTDYVPATFAGTDAEVLVGRQTAFQIDQAEVTDTYMPLVFIFVLTCSFLLLMVAFHSIVVPIKAILMNLLSVGAAYGLLVLVFQKGVGAEFFGFQQVDVIQTGLPLFLFAVLFGLSMDYHVFLISRIRERFLETGDNDEAVAYGLRTTSRLITGAALIMVAVFSGFAMGDMVPLQQMGFGLAVAVLVDATIIRTILVPASMSLLGKWNWYMPSFLNWLPELHLEGPTTKPTASAAD